jgi:hypothetical protein
MDTKPTKRAAWKSSAKKWSTNAHAAKERKRIALATSTEPLPDEPAYVGPVLPRANYATVSIRCGKESICVRVYRHDDKRLLLRGKPQAASTIGKRLALVLEAVLA